MPRRFWMTSISAVAVLAGVSHAGPMVIEEKAKISTPDPSYFWPQSVAIDGDWIIATGSKDAATAERPSLRDNSAWLYQRQSNGSWRLIKRLHQYFVEEDGDEPLMKVDMQGGVAAILKEGASWIFELTGTGWVLAQSEMSTDGMDVEVHNGTVAVTAGHCDWIANAYRKAADGVWRLVRSTPGEGVECENEDDRGDVDIYGSTIIVATFGDILRPPSARIFEGPFGSSPNMVRLLAPGDNPRAFGRPVALESTTALVGGGPEDGIHVYTRQTAGYWAPNGALLRPDSLALANISDAKAKMRGVRAIVGDQTDALHGVRTGSVSVFQRNSDGTFRYVARLMSSDRGREQALGHSVEISGARIVASSPATQSFYIFELPSNLTQPATINDTFEDGNYNGWQPISGSAFAVATTSASKVLRQSSDAYAAAAYLDTMDWRNQAIEADIKPTAFNSGTGEKWFGLVARYTDAGNYYYVTMRNTNLVQLKKMVNGSYVTLASADLPVALNRSYRVRLEAIGTRVRVFVDNQLALEARDTALTHGRAGIYMYKTKADYDNIAVSANPYTKLASYSFGDAEGDSSPSWEQLGTWTLAAESSGNRVYAQTSLETGTRTITGIDTGDQIVQARMKATAFAGGDNWLGLAARYRGEGNYYYVTLRNGNVISLRRQINGSIYELARAPLTVALNTWYTVRFEAIGSELRVYINNQLKVAATDTAHSTGRYGAIAYKTALQLDDLTAMEP